MGRPRINQAALR